MKQPLFNKTQQGVTLVVSILFLLILTIISVYAATNSSLELKMAGNMQDSMASFQSAEAGAIATLNLADSSADPFDGTTLNQYPFAGWTSTPHPLANVSGGSSAVIVNITLTTKDTDCPRQVQGFSADLLACVHYDIQSVHAEVKKARTEVHLGTVKTFIDDASL